jgi:hypothetical protein
MRAHAFLVNGEEVLLSVCHAKGARARDVISITVLSRLLEDEGIRRSDCMACVDRAVQRGWVERGPLLGQITLTVDAFAVL